MASSENIARYRVELDAGCGSEHSDDLDCDITASGAHCAYRNAGTMAGVSPNVPSDQNGIHIEITR